MQKAHGPQLDSTCIKVHAMNKLKTGILQTSLKMRVEFGVLYFAVYGKKFSVPLNILSSVFSEQSTVHNLFNTNTGARRHHFSKDEIFKYLKSKIKWIKTLS